MPGLLPANAPEAADEDVDASLHALPKGAALRLIGGDVLLRAALPRWVAVARQRGAADVTVQTSGHPLLREGVAVALRTMGVTAVATPLFGADADGHDYLVGRAGAFAASLRGLYAARAAGLAIELIAPALRPTMRGLDALAGRALGLGVRKVQLVVPAPGADASPPLVPHPRLAAEHVQRAGRLVLAARRQLLVEGLPDCLLGDVAHGRAPSPAPLGARVAAQAASLGPAAAVFARQSAVQEVAACAACRWHACCAGAATSQVERFGEAVYQARSDAPPPARVRSARRAGTTEGVGRSQ